MFSLQIQDFAKGLVIFVIGAIFTALLQMLQDGFSGIDLKRIALIAAISGISYIVKNCFSTEDGKFLGRIG